MDSDFKLIFIPNFKRFQVSGVRAEASRSFILKPETMCLWIEIKLE
jgi:hypothetical protein